MIKIPTLSSYGPTDIIPVFRYPNIIDTKPMVFGEVATISYSYYRDRFPVRACGSVQPKGYTAGPRTVAGSLVFKLLDYSAINKFIKSLYKTIDDDLSLMPDELPPFSIDITFANEYGTTTKQSIIGCQITEGNQIITIEQLTISEQFSFVAQDIKQIDKKYQENTHRKNSFDTDIYRDRRR